MMKKTHYLLLLAFLIVSSGCETIHGATTGFGQDVQNLSDPSTNGWNAINKADAWMQQNMW